MKKFLLMAACIIMMSMTASAISINKAMLVHNGNVTLFDGIQDAINASADGDAVYLTLGTFKGPITITRKITVRGTGETSIIDGDVEVSIPGSPKLENPVLEALTVTGTVTISTSLSNLNFIKCKINGKLALNGNINGGKTENCIIGTITTEGQIDKFFIDRCFVTNTLNLSSGIKGMTVTNTKLLHITAFQGASSNTTFVNCNIQNLHSTYFSGTIINSIIYLSCYYNSYNKADLLSTVLLNSLIYSYNNNVIIGASSVAQNCYYQRSSVNNGLIDSSCNCYYSISQLQSMGFLGTDGTVVGIYGGETPYSETDMLVPSVPKVTNSDLQLDNENKQLNVKLTVSPQ